MESQLVVAAATAQVLHDHPGWKDQAMTITEAAISAIDNKEVVQIGEVEDFILGRISYSSLLPEERALVSVIISRLKQNFEDSLVSQNILESCH